jgi:hypothetical protein
MWIFFVRYIDVGRLVQRVRTYSWNIPLQDASIKFDYAAVS